MKPKSSITGRQVLQQARALGIVALLFVMVPSVPSASADECSAFALTPLPTPPSVGIPEEQQSAASSPAFEPSFCAEPKQDCFKWNRNGGETTCSKSGATEAWSGTTWHAYYCDAVDPRCQGIGAQGLPTDGWTTGRVTWGSTEACQINGQNGCLVEQFIEGMWIESSRVDGVATELHANTAKSSINGDGTHGFAYY